MYPRPRVCPSNVDNDSAARVFPSNSFEVASSRESRERDTLDRGFDGRTKKQIIEAYENVCLSLVGISRSERGTPISSTCTVNEEVKSRIGGCVWWDVECRECR